MQNFSNCHLSLASHNYWPDMSEHPPESNALVSVRFRDSRVGYGASRYCQAAISDDFMTRLTPVNRVILQGLANSKQNTVPASPRVTRRTAPPAPVSKESKTVPGKSDKPKSRKRQVSEVLVEENPPELQTAGSTVPTPLPTKSTSALTSPLTVYCGAKSTEADIVPSSSHFRRPTATLTLPPSTNQHSRFYQHHLSTFASSSSASLPLDMSSLSFLSASQSPLLTAAGPPQIDPLDMNVTCTYDFWLWFQLMGFDRRLSLQDPNLFRYTDVLSLQDIGPNPAAKFSQFTPLELITSEQTAEGTNSQESTVMETECPLDREIQQLQVQLWHVNRFNNSLLAALRKKTIERADFWKAGNNTTTSSSAAAVSNTTSKQQKDNPSHSKKKSSGGEKSDSKSKKKSDNKALSKAGKKTKTTATVVADGDREEPAVKKRRGRPPSNRTTEV